MAVGRVGNNQLTNEILFNIRKQLLLQERLFEQISSNKRILKPSDDPVGTGSAMSIRDQMGRNRDYESSIQTGNVWTNVTNVALESANQEWQRVNEIALSADDGTKTATDLVGMAEELEQLLERLVALSNTQNAGAYVFGGSKTNNPAFRAETDPNTGRITGVFYQGDSFVRSVQTKEEGRTDVNVLGSNGGNPDAAGSFIDTNTGANAFNTIIELRDRLLDNDVIGISQPGGILQDIELVTQSLNGAQVRLGGAQEVFDMDKERIIEEQDDLTQFLSQVEDADVAKLIMELNNVQNVYEAALASGGRIMQLGLLSFI